MTISYTKKIYHVNGFDCILFVCLYYPVLIEKNTKKKSSHTECVLYKQKLKNYFCICRTVKPQVRHAWREYSFDGNQSFPRVSRRLRPIRMELETPTKIKPADLVRG